MGETARRGARRAGRPAGGRRVVAHDRPVPAAIGRAPARSSSGGHPAEFDALGDHASALGFAHVESGPLVRSSYHAREGADRLGRAAGAEIPRHNGPVADRFRSLSADLAQWWCEQPVFFVATAPSGPDGHVNLSPKGYDTLRVLGPNRVAYLDLTGSGVETIAHLRENGTHHAHGVRVHRQPANLAHLRPRHRASGSVRPASTGSRTEFPDAAGPACDHRSRGRAASRPRAATRCR